MDQAGEASGDNELVPVKLNSPIKVPDITDNHEE